MGIESESRRWSWGAWRNPGAWLGAAGGISFVLSRRWLWIQTIGWSGAWPALLAAAPLVLGRSGAWGWLGVLGVELGFPCFAARLSPFLPALAAMLCLTDLAWFSGWKPAFPAKWTRPRLWLASFLLGLSLPVLQLSGLLDRPKPLTGDEPAYLMASLSLLEDGDLVMNNQYRAREYTKFGTAQYPTFAHTGLDGRLYPHHNAGLPALLTLPLGLGLGDPARAELFVRLFMALLAAAAVAETAMLALQLTDSPAAALASAAILAWTVPFGFYATQVYPEIPAALIVVAVYRRSLGLRPKPGQGAEPPGSQGAAKLPPDLFFSKKIPTEVQETESPGGVQGQRPWLGLLAGALVWLHSKFLPLTLLLCLAHCLRPASWRARLGFCLAAAAPVLPFLWFVHHVYGVWTPAALQLGVDAAGRLPVSGLESSSERLWHAPLNLLGYFLDQRIGLLLYAPVYLFAAAGLRRLRAVELLALGLAPLGVYAWVYWSMGGYGPPNRPAVPGAPFLAVLAGVGWTLAPRRGLRFTLAAASLWCSGALLLHNAAMYHPMSVRSETARNQLLAYHGPAGWDLTAWLPAYLGESLNFWPNLVFPIAAVGLGWWIARGAAPGPRQETPSPGPLWEFFGKKFPGVASLRLASQGPQAPGGVWGGAPFRGPLALLALALLLLRAQAVERTPAQIERGAEPAALVLSGEAWAEPDGAVWVGGAGWARLLLPDRGGAFAFEAPGAGRICLRSGPETRCFDLDRAGSGRLQFSRPWRLTRAGRAWLLVEAASREAYPEPNGPRSLGLRLSAVD